MKLESIAFENGEMIPEKFTCDGEGVNPSLSLLEIPPEARSLALVVDDPDSPSGTFVHWTVWNIAPDTEEIRENSVPVDATEGKTDFGQIGFGGPCPHTGLHRYFFRLYALSSPLDLPSGSSREELRNAMEEKIIAEAEFMGKYEGANNS